MFAITIYGSQFIFEKTFALRLLTLWHMRNAATKPGIYAPACLPAVLAAYQHHYKSGET